MSMKDPTTIKIDKPTRERLRTLGAKDESYDEVIQRLLVVYDGVYTPETD